MKNHIPKMVKKPSKNHPKIDPEKSEKITKKGGTDFPRFSADKGGKGGSRRDPPRKKKCKLDSILDRTLQETYQGEVQGEVQIERILPKTQHASGACGPGANFGCLRQ